MTDNATDPPKRRGQGKKIWDENGILIIKQPTEKTLEKIREWYVYDEATGTLSQTNGKPLSKRPFPNRHRCTHAQIIWFLYYGEWPNRQIERHDGDPNNNHIDNLFLDLIGANGERRRRYLNSEHGRAHIREYKERTREEANAKHRAKYATGEYAYNRKPLARFKAMIRNGKARQQETTLTFEDFLELDELPCTYCNNEMMGGVKHNGHGYGLDRINPDIGYTRDNVHPCCTTCNFLRSDMLTVEETHAAVQAVLAYRRENNIIPSPDNTALTLQKYFIGVK